MAYQATVAWPVAYQATLVLNFSSRVPSISGPHRSRHVAHVMLDITWPTPCLPSQAHIMLAITWPTSSCHHMAHSMPTASTVPPACPPLPHPPGLPAPHAEIVELVELLQPSPEEAAARHDAVCAVRKVVQSIWPKAQVNVFGSFNTGKAGCRQGLSRQARQGLGRQAGSRQARSRQAGSRQADRV